MRKASSLLELIVSIVIMAIVVSAVPLVIKRDNDSHIITLQQEVILALQTQMLQILPLDWDENSYHEGDGITKILNVSGSNCINTRKGIKNRQCTNTNKTATMGGGGKYDIGHYNGKTIHVDLSSRIAEALKEANKDGDYLDYVFNPEIKSEVKYLDYKANSAGNSISITDIDKETTTKSTDVKQVLIKTKIVESADDIILRAFVSNIGQVKPVTRDFQ